MKLSARIVHVHVGVGWLFRERKKIGIWALDIGSNGCRLTSIAWNWKLNEREKWIHVDWSSWLNCEANKLKLDYEICSGLIHSGEQYQDNQGLCIFVSGIQFGELSVFEVTSLELKWKRMLSDASDCITFLNRSYQRVIFGYSFEEWNVLMYRLLQCMFEQLDRRYLMRQPVELSVDMLLWYAQVTLRLLWMLGMIGYRSQGR